MRQSQRTRPGKRQTVVVLWVDVAEVVVVEAEEAVAVVVAGVVEAVVDEDGVSRLGKKAVSRRKIRITTCKPGQDDGRCTFEIRKSRVGDSVRFRNPRLIKCVRDHFWRSTNACARYEHARRLAKLDFVHGRSILNREMQNDTTSNNDLECQTSQRMHMQTADIVQPGE
jgi:hypothetical protein